MDFELHVLTTWPKYSSHRFRSHTEVMDGRMAGKKQVASLADSENKLRF